MRTAYLYISVHGKLVSGQQCQHIIQYRAELFFPPLTRPDMDLLLDLVDYLCLVLDTGCPGQLAQIDTAS